MVAPAVGTADRRSFLYSFCHLFNSTAFSCQYGSTPDNFVFAGRIAGSCWLDYGSQRINRRRCLCTTNPPGIAFCFCFVFAPLYCGAIQSGSLPQVGGSRGGRSGCRPADRFFGRLDIGDSAAPRSSTNHAQPERLSQRAWVDTDFVPIARCIMGNSASDDAAAALSDPRHRIARATRPLVGNRRRDVPRRRRGDSTNPA